MKRIIVTLLTVTAIAGGCTSQQGQAAEASAATTLFVSPQGSSSTCSTASPCTLDTALSKAASGSVIKLATGNYGSVVLRSKKQLTSATTNVVVTPATTSATPTFVGLDSSVAHVTWRDITATGAWFLRDSAVGSRVEKSHIDGGGLFLRSTDITVTGSLFENGSSIDGIQVGGATNALIESNVIRNYNQDRPNGLHADCIQVFDSSDITIRGNRLGNCYNSGLIISRGAGEGITNLLIESNFIQGCIIETSKCRGGSATDLREPTTNGLIVRNNTITDGSTRLADLRGLTFDRNIVEYMAECNPPMTNSIITKWNTGLCGPNPPFTTTRGNRVSTVAFVNQDAGNLLLADRSTATINPQGTTAPAPRSITGTPMRWNVAGAAN